MFKHGKNDTSSEALKISENVLQLRGLGQMYLLFHERRWYEQLLKDQQIFSL